LWAVGAQAQALEEVSGLSSSLSPAGPEARRLLVRALLKKGDWRLSAGPAATRSATALQASAMTLQTSAIRDAGRRGRG